MFPTKAATLTQIVQSSRNLKENPCYHCDILLALARDEYESEQAKEEYEVEVAREEYEKEKAQEENAKQCCNPFPCLYNGKNGKSCDECGFFNESEDEFM